MKPKHLFLAIAALLAAGGLWLARSAWHAHASQKTSLGLGSKTSSPQTLPQGEQAHAEEGASIVTSQTQESRGGSADDSPKTGHLLRPPVPNRRFTDFTPEQRVQFARQGHGPGG